MLQSGRQVGCSNGKRIVLGFKKRLCGSLIAKVLLQDARSAPCGTLLAAPDRAHRVPAQTFFKFHVIPGLQEAGLAPSTKRAPIWSHQRRIASQLTTTVEKRWP
jgi:hypothetical protein